MEYLFPQNTSIREVDFIYSEFTRLLASGESLSIDVSQVERMDTPVVQLLLVANDAVLAAKHTISWNNPSPAFLSTINLLGLAERFNAVV